MASRVIWAVIPGALAALAVGATASGSVDDSESHVESFREWAEEQVAPVELYACSEPAMSDDGETQLVACYGVGGEQIVAAALTFDPGSGELLGITPLKPRTRFGDGTYAVGRDIVPGYYVTETATPDCDWTRTPAEGGDFVEEGGDEQQDVDILPTDVSFETWDCGTWELVSDE